MTSVDYRDRLAGSPTAVPSAYLIGTSPVLVAPSTSGRICVTLQPDLNVFVGVASNFNATTACIGYVGSGGYYQERDYTGDLYVKAEGATGVVRRFGV